MDQETQKSIPTPSAATGLVGFLRGVFSDGDIPSSSRILTFSLCIGTFVLLACLVHHVCTIKDTAALALWLTALPLLIGSLIGFAAAPYAINRGSGTVTDILSSLKKQAS